MDRKDGIENKVEHDRRRAPGEAINSTGRESPGTAGKEPTEPSAAPSAGADFGDESVEGSEAEKPVRPESGEE